MLRTAFENCYQLTAQGFFASKATQKITAHKKNNKTPVKIKSKAKNRLEVTYQSPFLKLVPEQESKRRSKPADRTFSANNLLPL